MDKKHRLKVKFFSAIPIHNITILCRFPKYSNEFFELAHYDEIMTKNISYLYDNDKKPIVLDVLKKQINEKTPLTWDYVKGHRDVEAEIPLDLPYTVIQISTG